MAQGVSDVGAVALAIESLASWFSGGSKRKTIKAESDANNAVLAGQNIGKQYDALGKLIEERNQNAKAQIQSVTIVVVVAIVLVVGVTIYVISSKRKVKP